MSILADAARTVRQMPGPRMRGPVLKGVLTTLAAIVGLAVTLGAWITSLLDGVTIPWTDIPLAGAGGVLAGAGSLAAAWFVFIPAAALVVSFFIDGVAGAVEAKHWPQAGPGRDRALSLDLWISVKAAALALVVNLPLIPFYFLFPPLPAFVNGVLLGREYFLLSALRHHPMPEAKALRRRATLAVVLGGAIFALLATIPLLNLVAPVFGAGLMTHAYNRTRERSGAAVAF